MKFIKKLNVFNTPDDEDLRSKNFNRWFLGDKKHDKIEKIIHLLFYISIIFFINLFILYLKPRDEITNQILWIKDNFPFFKGYLFYIFVIAITFLISLVIGIMHELIHIVFIPDWIKSDKTYAGLFFKKRIFQGFAVRTYEPMSKVRYLFMGLAPVIFLSVIPITFMLITPYWNFMILIVCFFNISGSSADIYSAYLILKKVPKNAVIINGYYK